MLWTCEKLPILFRSKDSRATSTMKNHAKNMSKVRVFLYIYFRVMLSWTYKNLHIIILYRVFIFIKCFNEWTERIVPRNIFKCLYIHVIKSFFFQNDILPYRVQRIKRHKSKENRYWAIKDWSISLYRKFALLT